MAIINYKEGDDPTKKNQFGVVSGVDLTAPVILNNNPLDIEFVNGKNPEEVTRKWNVFFEFLKSKKINTDINSLEGQKQVSLPLIEEFNTNKKTSFWAEIGESIKNPLTRDDIFAIQKFNQKTDPNIQVDGWVGTQTKQLKYPLINFLLINFKNYERNKFVEYSPKDYPDNTLIPIIWGNKRYVISKTDYFKSVEQKISSFPFWKIYSPTSDKNLLSWKTMSLKLRTNFPSQPEWDKLDNTVDIENTISINQQTQQIQQIKTQFQSQTNLINQINR
jgi:hypothetical protein